MVSIIFLMAGGVFGNTTPGAYDPLFCILKHTGKTSMVWIGATPRVIVMDPELMKEVLSDKSGHIQKPQTNPLIRILAQGVSSLEGDEWFHRKRIINPAFHLEKLKGMIHGFSTCCDELIKRWVELAGPEGSCEVDVWPELQNFTGDVISRTAFGSNYEEGKRIFTLQKEQVELVINAAMGVYISGFRFLPTKKNKRRMYLDKEIKGMLRDLINRKKKSMKMGDSSNDHLLGLLLHFINYENALENKSNSNKHGLTIEVVIEECKLFYWNTLGRDLANSLLKSFIRANEQTYTTANKDLCWHLKYWR